MSDPTKAPTQPRKVQPRSRFSAKIATRLWCPRDAATKDGHAVDLNLGRVGWSEDVGMFYLVKIEPRSCRILGRPRPVRSARPSAGEEDVLAHWTVSGLRVITSGGAPPMKRPIVEAFRSGLVLK